MAIHQSLVNDDHDYQWDLNWMGDVNDEWAFRIMVNDSSDNKASRTHNATFVLDTHGCLWLRAISLILVGCHRDCCDHGNSIGTKSASVWGDWAAQYRPLTKVNLSQCCNPAKRSTGFVKIAHGWFCQPDQIIRLPLHHPNPTYPGHNCSVYRKGQCQGAKVRSDLRHSHRSEDVPWVHGIGLWNITLLNATNLFRVMIKTWQNNDSDYMCTLNYNIAHIVCLSRQATTNSWPTNIYNFYLQGWLGLQWQFPLDAGQCEDSQPVKYIHKLISSW